MKLLSVLIASALIALFPISSSAQTVPSQKSDTSSKEVRGKKKKLRKKIEAAQAAEAAREKK